MNLPQLHGTVSVGSFFSNSWRQTGQFLRHIFLPVFLVQMGLSTKWLYYASNSLVCSNEHETKSASSWTVGCFAWSGYRSWAHIYAMNCPLYRTLHKAIQLTSSRALIIR